MPFIEIAFQAEVSRFEDQDFEELARRNCNEDPDDRSKKIEELRSMIYERGECNPRRIDDAYLLRFLRCRRFIPALAHKLMVRYEQFRRDYAYLYNCDAFGLHKVKNVYGGTLPESPRDGRIILMRFGRWDPDSVTITDVVRCALLMDEVAVLQPKMQILGVTIIVDLQGLGLRHVRHLTPTIAHQIVSLMGLLILSSYFEEITRLHIHPVKDLERLGLRHLRHLTPSIAHQIVSLMEVSFPLPMHGLHIVNYSWFLNKFFYVFKQFIPKTVWSHLFFHADMASLHSHIDPEYLPPEYGGYSRHVITTEQWIPKIDKYKDDFLVQELRNLGFTVNS